MQQLFIHTGVAEMRHLLGLSRHWSLSVSWVVSPRYIYAVGVGSSPFQEKWFLPFTQLSYLHSPAIDLPPFAHILIKQKLVPLTNRGTETFARCSFCQLIKRPLLPITFPAQMCSPVSAPPWAPQTSLQCVSVCTFCGCDPITHVVDQLNMVQWVRASQIRCLITAVGCLAVSWTNAQEMLIGSISLWFS